MTYLANKFKCRFRSKFWNNAIIWNMAVFQIGARDTFYYMRESYLFRSDTARSSTQLNYWVLRESLAIGSSHVPWCLTLNTLFFCSRIWTCVTVVTHGNEVFFCVFIPFPCGSSVLDYFNMCNILQTWCWVYIILCIV